MDHPAYQIVPIDESTWALDEGMVRSYLLAGEDYALLIDTGNGAGDLRAAVEDLTKLPILLVNTHADVDHLGCNSQFDFTCLHPSEFALLESKHSRLPHRPVCDGQILELGGRSIQVLLIPGHTPGSIALLDEGRRMLFSGDTVSLSPIFMFGEHRSMPAYHDSMNRLDQQSARFDRIYPAHGPMPVPVETIGKLRACCEACMMGQIEGTKPPMDVPAKLYLLDGVGFLG